MLLQSPETINVQIQWAVASSDFENYVLLSWWLAATFGTKEASISKESTYVGDIMEDCAAIQKDL